MSKQIIIDPEWEQQEERKPRPAARVRRAEPEELDPFGVERIDVLSEEPPFDPDIPGEDDFAKEPPAPHRAASPPPPAPEPQEEPDSFAEPEEKLASRTKQYIGMLLSGSILTRAEVKRTYPYMAMIAFLMLLYISSVFRMQQLHRREIELQREVKELRATSLELSSRRMNLTRQSRILEELQARGIPLKEAVTPPKIIEK